MKGPLFIGSNSNNICLQLRLHQYLELIFLCIYVNFFYLFFFWQNSYKKVFKLTNVPREVRRYSLVLIIKWESKTVTADRKQIPNATRINQCFTTAAGHCTTIVFYGK